jgi:non-ribosomal peptide synthetase component E (peptide arylation enzyme)
VPPAVSLWLQAIHEWGGNAQLQSLQAAGAGARVLPQFRRKSAELPAVRHLAVGW